MNKSLLLFSLFCTVGSSHSMAVEANSPVEHDQQNVSEGDWREAAQAEIDKYREEHPDDFIGIDNLLAKYGLPGMAVSISGVEGELTGSEAQQILEDRRAEAFDVSTRAIPADALGVWIAVQLDLYFGRVVTGNWNFRDNFINGSAPDDVATIQVNLADGCFRPISNGVSYRVSDYTGAVQNNRLYLMDGGLGGSVVLGIRDRTSGFKLLVDNGYFQSRYERTKKSGCGDAKLGAQFQYEHNQDGENGISAEVSWGFFSLAYSAPATTLRKSSQILWK